MKVEGSVSGSVLRARWLLAARMAWIAFVFLAVGLYILSIPTQIAARETLCSGSACTYDQISPRDLQLLQQVGGSLHANALYCAAGHGLFWRGLFVVGPIIFCRRSRGRIGTFSSPLLG